MLRLRRTAHDARVEIVPLIDVIFLLLTFFIYAMVLMVRVEVLGLDLQSFRAGEPAQPAPAVTISIDLHGQIFVDTDAVPLDDVLPRLRRARETNPETVIYLALADGEGTIDRAPLLTALWDRLKDARLEINFVGRPDDFPPP